MSKGFSYCLFLFLFAMLIATIFIFKKEVLVIPVLSNGKTYYEEKIQDQTSKYKINASFPHTEYQKLNQQIKNKIKEEVDSFKALTKNIQTTDHQQYTLNIWYDFYSYQNYLSFHFYVTTDTKGAHPNTHSFSINYNKKNNQIVSINDLKKQNKNLYQTLSNYTYHTLIKSKKIGNSNFEQNLLKTGTAPKEANFHTFVFTKEGLLFFFDRYQVAPYAYGDFYVTIPYDYLEFSKNSNIF